MAYAAYRELLGPVFSAQPVAAPVWQVMDVTVPSRDALAVRRAVAACLGAGILRCIPRLDEQRVRLEIRLPASLAGDVMHRVMVCVPDGEIGHLMSWACHLQRHHLSAGA